MCARGSWKEIEKCAIVAEYCALRLRKQGSRVDTHLHCFNWTGSDKYRRKLVVNLDAQNFLPRIVFDERNSLSRISLWFFH